jgi:3-dehydroquinate synthase
MSETHESPLRVSLGERSYEIHVAPGALARAGELIPRPGDSTAFIITHPIVARLHGKALAAGLRGLPAETILVPSGERQKSIRRAALLWDELLRRGADRRSLVIAFGGGVIGDLAGFVAATYMRGVPYVQIPTTLLAQVDSSVGGKVAINHPRAKNLIGAFHQPRLVLADVLALSTLSARNYREGLAEVVKHAVIADADLFAWLEQNAAAILQRDPGVLARLVRRNCEIKAGVVSADERETGLRSTLNFGHTAGHAVESLASYGQLRHGEAVAIGMMAAARIARLTGLFPEAEEARLGALLAAFRLPVRIEGASAAAVLDVMRADKKSLGGLPRFVLPTRIGHVEFGREVPAAVVQKALEEVGARD